MMEFAFCSPANEASFSWTRRLSCQLLCYDQTDFRTGYAINRATSVCVLLLDENDAVLGNDVRGDEGDLLGTVTSNDFGFPKSGCCVIGLLTALSGGSYVEQNNSANEKL